MNFKIKIYNNLTESVKDIRKKVFISEQGFTNEFDENDDISTYIVLIENNKPFATARIYCNENIYYIGRVAVLKEYRNMHFGSVLLKEAEKIIKNKDGHIILLSAQEKVKGFYEKNGYEVVSSPYLDEFCIHVTMKKII